MRQSIILEMERMEIFDISSCCTAHTFVSFTHNDKMISMLILSGAVRATQRRQGIEALFTAFSFSCA